MLQKISHYSLLLIIILLISCGGDTNPESLTPTARIDEAAVVDIEIINTTPEIRVVKTEETEQPNCGGTDSIENVVSRSRAITHIIEVGGGFTISAEGSVGISGTNVQLGTAVASHLNYSYGTEETLERSVIVKAAPGSHMRHTIEQQEIWDVGEAIITINGQETNVPFSFRRDFAVQSIDSENLECPLNGGSDPTKTPAEETPTSTSTPDSTPTNAPTPLPTSLPSPTITSFPNNVIEVNQTQVSDRDNFSLTIKTIELLPNGRMRWNLEYWNQSNENARVQIDYEATYLADEYGNRYSVLGAKDGIGTGLNVTVEAGVKIDHWVEFMTPIDGASQFVVNFVEFGNSGVANFPIANVFLSYTFEIPTLTPTPVSENIILVLEINQTQVSDRANFDMTIRSIEFLPNGRMRWNLEYWNQSNENARVQIDYEATYLADEYGNRYSVLGAKDGIGTGLNVTVEAGVKVDHWVEFMTPMDGASQFVVNFVEFGNSGVANFPIANTFLDYDSNFLPTSTPTPFITDAIAILEMNETVNSDRDNFTLTVRSIEILPNERMRWNLEFWNQSNENAKAQINYSTTYLADEFGNRYSVITAENGLGQGYNTTIEAGVRVYHWIEFSMPIDGAKNFIVEFVEFGNSGVANFDLFNILLPEY